MSKAYQTVMQTEIKSDLKKQFPVRKTTTYFGRFTMFFFIKTFLKFLAISTKTNIYMKMNKILSWKFSFSIMYNNLFPKFTKQFQIWVSDCAVYHLCNHFRRINIVRATAIASPNDRWFSIDVNSCMHFRTIRPKTPFEPSDPQQSWILLNDSIV